MILPPTDNLDCRWMHAALALARRGIGRTWPNPAVGCILIQPGDPGCVVGRGWTQPGGRPHAETEALGRAGTAARGATAYLTLEPCAHVGKTAPCVDALIERGVARVVIALEDPDPRVSGAGNERLKKAGIKTDVGCLGEVARQVNAGFLSRVNEGRPLVAWKTATTLDGKIAGIGHSQWISGQGARARGHLLRARFDAILTGMGTLMADDPQLTCRLPGLEDRSPIRVLMAGERPLPDKHKLLATGCKTPTWVYRVLEKTTNTKAQQLGDGVEVIPIAGNNLPDPRAVLADLANRGITRVLIEAGASIAASFFMENLIDEIHWFRAPNIIGEGGVAAIGRLGNGKIKTMENFKCVGRCDIGVDTYEVYQREANEYRG